MEQEKKGDGGGKEGSAVVMVDQSETHVKPYRPTEIQQESDIHHKRSRAPVVPSVAEELKNLAEDAIANQNVDPREIKDNEGAMSSDHKHKVFKKSSKRQDRAPDIPLQPLDDESKKDATDVLQQKSIPLPSQPIPPQLQEGKSEASVVEASKEDAQRNTEEDSITDEVRESQTPGETKRHSEWSDEEEAGGLPRSESRASRVSRAVKQLFCCGVRYEAASEDNISTRSGFNHGI